MRTAPKTLVVCFMTALITLPALAQIQKGSYSLGGDVGVNAYLQRGKVYDITSFNASVSPSVGKFLTDKWLVGVRPILTTQISNATYSAFGDSNRKHEYKNNFTRLGLELSSRYYIKTGGKLKLFGFAQASYYRALSYGYYRPYNSDVQEADINGNFLNYEGGLGGNYFFKPDVAVEGTLSYAHSEVPFSNFFLILGRVNASENVLLNFKMSNFIGSFSPRDKNAPPQYIKRGRQVVGGNASLLRTKVTNKAVSTIFQFNPQFSQLITDKLMLTGNINWQGNIKDDNISTLAASASARYYIPVKNRFFVYPELSYIHKSGLSSDYKNTVGLGFGGSYFLTENIALEASFVQAQLRSRANNYYFESQNFVSTLGLGNVGLTYFIR